MAFQLFLLGGGRVDRLGKQAVIAEPFLLPVNRFDKQVGVAKDERGVDVGAGGVVPVLGVDGLGLPMVILTTFLGFVSVFVSWKINLRVKEYFICEYRGKLPVKYKGNIDMYYVNGLRPELAVDLKGIPNKRFYMQLQLLRLGDLEEKVFSDILEKLPESLHFHRLEYASKVYNQSFLFN